MQLLYIGEHHNTHDRRFYSALEELGPTKKIFVCETNDLILDLSNFDAIVAGPLTKPISILPHDLSPPLIGICHAFEVNENVGNVYLETMIKANISKCSQIICDNPYIHDLLLTKFECHVPITTIPYGCDLSLMQSKYSDFGMKIRLLSMRNWTPIHGNSIIIAAMKLLREEDIFESVVFAGEGPELDKAKTEIEQLEPSYPVYFEGFLDSSKISEAIKKSNVYVSAARSDGTSVSLMEAMAGRLIPCVSDFKGNLNVIDFGINGYYFENENPQSLAAILRQIFLTNSDDRKKIAENAGAYADSNFDWMKNKEIFKKVIIEEIQNG